eukprot:6470179-Amphidinium_carterae.1
MSADSESSVPPPPPPEPEPAAAAATPVQRPSLARARITAAQSDETLAASVEAATALVAGMSKTKVNQTARAALSAPSALDLTDLNGLAEVADVSAADSREYVTHNQKLALPTSSATKSVKQFIFDYNESDERGRLFLELVAANLPSFRTRETGLAIKQAAALAFARAYAIVDIVILNHNTVDETAKMAHAASTFFKENEMHFVTVIAVGADAEANRVTIPAGVTVAVVVPAEINTLVEMASDIENCGRLRLLGICAVVISKTMLFRSGHHFISSESHMGQIDRAHELSSMTMLASWGSI